jgi:hypothetical protein
MVLLLILLLQLSGATSPERHVSGEGSSAEIESSDLGRKGRAGATGEIFTAGMFDLSGQFFYLKKSDSEIVQSDRFEFSFLKSQPSLPVATKLKQLNDQAFNNKHTHADFRIDVGGVGSYLQPFKIKGRNAIPLGQTRPIFSFEKILMEVMCCKCDVFVLRPWGRRVATTCNAGGSFGRLSQKRNPKK